MKESSEPYEESLQPPKTSKLHLSIWIRPGLDRGWSSIPVNWRSTHLDDFLVWYFSIVLIGSLSELIPQNTYILLFCMLHELWLYLGILRVGNADTLPVLVLYNSHELRAVALYYPPVTAIHASPENYHQHSEWSNRLIFKAFPSILISTSSSVSAGSMSL